jgi:hypothetical protein
MTALPLSPLNTDQITAHSSVLLNPSHLHKSGDSNIHHLLAQLLSIQLVQNGPIHHHQQHNGHSCKLVLSVVGLDPTSTSAATFSTSNDRRCNSERKGMATISGPECSGTAAVRLLDTCVSAADGIGTRTVKLTSSLGYCQKLSQGGHF